MKRTLVIIISLFLCIIVILFIRLKNVEMQESNIKKSNLQYEQYLNREIQGTDIATLINKAVDNNEKYGVKKDESGIYIEDDEYSIRIEIYIAINDTVYPMEAIFNYGTNEFVENFNTILFKSEKVEYHSNTGRISKIVFKQIEV